MPKPNEQDIVKRLRGTWAGMEQEAANAYEAADEILQLRGALRRISVLEPSKLVIAGDIAADALAQIVGAGDVGEVSRRESDTSSTDSPLPLGPETTGIVEQLRLVAHSIDSNEPVPYDWAEVCKEAARKIELLQAANDYYKAQYDCAMERNHAMAEFVSFNNALADLGEQIRAHENRGS